MTVFRSVGRFLASGIGVAAACSTAILITSGLVSALAISGSVEIVFVAACCVITAGAAIEGPTLIRNFTAAFVATRAWIAKAIDYLLIAFVLLVALAVLAVLWEWIWLVSRWLF